MRIPILIAAAVLFSTSFLPAGREQNDTLWNRAVRVAESTANVMAGRITIREYGRDPRTGGSCFDQTVLTCDDPRPGGGIECSVVATTDYLGMPEARGDVGCTYAPAEGYIEIPMVNTGPLSSLEQSRVKSEPTGTRRKIEDRNCEVWSFRWKNRWLGKRRTVVGSACIDPDSALPLELRFSPRRLSRGLAAVEVLLRYGQTRGVGWNPVGFEIAITPSATDGVPHRLTGEYAEHRRIAHF